MPTADVPSQEQLFIGWHVDVTTLPVCAADLSLQLAELIAEADEELAITFLLVTGQSEDTCQVVALLTVLLLTEVAHLNTRQASRPWAEMLAVGDCLL